jgi:glycerate 2-kinase
LSLEAAAETARVYGLDAYILSDSVEGEARDVGLVHSAIVREIINRDRPFRQPAVLLSGGEATVTLNGSLGRGGRNGEFCLSLALALDGLPVTALAAGSDGIDGSEDNAGAYRITQAARPKS